MRVGRDDLCRAHDLGWSLRDNFDYARLGGRRDLTKEWYRPKSWFVRGLKCGSLHRCGILVGTGG